jgi:hypothetical protein
MDTPCYVNCPTLTTQSVAEQNKCKVAQSYEEDIDGCKYTDTVTEAKTQTSSSSYSNLSQGSLLSPVTQWCRGDRSCESEILELRKSQDVDTMNR